MKSTDIYITIIQSECLLIYISYSFLLETDPENTFMCEYCSRKMNSERLLRDHMRHHGTILLFKNYSLLTMSVDFKL